MLGAGDRGVQAKNALGVTDPPVAVGPLLGVLPVGEDRLEGTREVRVPVIVASFGVDELVEWCDVRLAGRQLGVDRGNVPPPPPADCLIGVAGHHHWGVEGEVEDAADVGT